LNEDSDQINPDIITNSNNIDIYKAILRAIGIFFVLIGAIVLFPDVKDAKPIDIAANY